MFMGVKTWLQEGKIRIYIAFFSLLLAVEIKTYNNERKKILYWNTKLQTEDSPQGYNLEDLKTDVLYVLSGSDNTWKEYIIQLSSIYSLTILIQ